MDSGLDLGYVVGEVGGVEEDFGRGVFEERGRFPPVQPPVERGVNCAQFAAGEKAIQMFDAVAGQDSHPVAFCDASFVAQPVC